MALGLVVLFVLFVWLLPPLLSRGSFDNDAARLKAENDVRTTLLQALAGAFLLLGLYFTARTLQLNRSGQITDRFTHAIDQLGAETNDVRLGGIYALERIAKDSDSDRETIYEVLAAFIRLHSPIEHDAAHLRKQQGEPTEPNVVQGEHVRAAIAVLGRRTSRTTDRALEFSGTDLRRAQWTGADLGGAAFWEANLNGAFLIGANLEGASLWGASLEDALLEEANLRGALLEHANLEHANLTRANLSEANLADANLKLAELEWATLRDAVLDDASLESANLRGAKLEDARLYGAKVMYANLSEAKLTGAKLAGADFADADLAGAELAGADLSDTLNLDLQSYLSTLTPERQRAFLDSQNQFLASLSPEDLVNFSLSADDLAKFAALLDPTTALDSGGGGT